MYERGDTHGVMSEQAGKLRRILLALDATPDLKTLKLPGFRLHQLKGPLRGFWSITVSGNWRVIFRFRDGDVFDVDLVDYH